MINYRTTRARSKNFHLNLTHSEGDFASTAPGCFFAQKDLFAIFFFPEKAIGSPSRSGRSNSGKVFFSGEHGRVSARGIGGGRVARGGGGGRRGRGRVEVQARPAAP